MFSFEIGCVVVIIILFVLLSDKYLPKDVLESSAYKEYAGVRNCMLPGFVVKNVIEGIESSGVTAGPVTSQYTSYDAQKHGPNTIVISLHYTDWCGACKQMKPVWEQLKYDLKAEGSYENIIFIENDEDKKRTPGVTGYPTIMKYMGGKMRKYDGRANYQQLRNFVLGTSIISNTGVAW